MSVRVLFFASLREAAGTGELVVALEEPVSVGDFHQRLASFLAPEVLQALTAENVRVAVNQTLVEGPARITPGDEVAFLPPVTGG